MLGDLFDEIFGVSKSRLIEKQTFPKQAASIPEEKSSIAAAIELCTFQSESELSKIDNQMVTIAEEVATLEARKKNLFGIEVIAKEELDRNITKLKERQTQLTGVKHFGGKYPRLSLEVFKWRDKSGYPKLAIFNLESPICRLKSVVSKDWGDRWYKCEHMVTPGLPPGIGILFNDVYEKKLDPNLRDKRPSSWTAIESYFRGVLPMEARQKIVSIQKEFEKVYIIAEANWEKKAEIKPDPLVIGWDGVNAWLIASFDLTTLENYIKSEATE